MIMISILLEKNHNDSNNSNNHNDSNYSINKCNDRSCGSSDKRKYTQLLK